MNSAPPLNPFYKPDTISLSLVRCTCIHCFATFGLNSEHDRMRREDHKEFWCPVCGKEMVFRAGNSDADRLRRELAAERAQLDQIKADRDYQRRARTKAEKSLTATRGVVTRIKNRVAAGVCPCCTRHFTNLERHMAGQHPEFKATEETK